MADMSLKGLRIGGKKINIREGAVQMPEIKIIEGPVFDIKRLFSLNLKKIFYCNFFSWFKNVL